MSIAAISSAISKVSKGISTATSGTLFNVKIPSNVGTKALGIDGAEITSLGDAVSAVKNAAQSVVQGLRMVGCIVGTLAHPMSIVNVLNQIGGMAATYAMQFASDIVDAIGQQLRQMVAQILGTAINVVRSILSLLTSIADLVEAIVEIYDKFRELGRNGRSFWLERQECEKMFGMIAACYFNKLIGNKLENFKQKALDKISEVGQDLNQHIAEQLADTNTIANFVQQESFMLNKATAQLRATSNTISNFEI